MTTKFPKRNPPKKSTQESDARPTPPVTDGPPISQPTERPAEVEAFLAEEPHQEPVISGPPVEADDVVTLKAADLQRLIDARVKAALDAAPKQTSVGASAAEIAQAVAVAISANQNAANMSEHARRLAEIKAREAKQEKCEVCLQSVSGCGGPWLKVSDLPKLTLDQREALPPYQEKDGFIIVDGMRYVYPAINHVQMCVFPKDDINAEYFTGAKVNGVNYLSNGPGHLLWLPAKNDVAAVISDFENGERRLRTPRKNIRNNGGSVSANGGTTTVPMHFT